MLAYCSEHRVGTADSFLSPVPHPKIEISKKNLLDLKMKMLAYCLGLRVGTADTSLSTVRPPKIEILKKILKR